MTETPKEPESLAAARAAYHKPLKDVVPHDPHRVPSWPIGFGAGGKGHEIVHYEVDDRGVRREVEHVAFIARPFWGWEWNQVNRQAREAETGLLPRDIEAMRKGGWTDDCTCT